MKLTKFIIYTILISSVITNQNNYAANQITNRFVLVEEFTGTWCGSCPYASDLLEDLKAKHSNICILAYHMYDEMGFDEAAQYFTLVSGGSGLMKSSLNSSNNTLLTFPCAVVDRTYFPNSNEDNPEGLTILQEYFEASISQQLTKEPTFSITLQCEFDASSRKVDIEATLSALENLNGNFRISLILSENELNYPQKLYKEQGDEELVDPYYHKHVVRDMVNGVTGEALEKTSFSKGENLSMSFSFSLNEKFIAENCQFVVVINRDLKNGIGPVEQAAEISIVNSTEVNLQNQKNRPQTFQLMQNYPNPFNPATTIQFQLKETGFVNLRIFDVLGRDVATLIHKRMPQGYHSIQWNGKNHPSGFYFYTLQVNNDFSKIKKMILQK